MRVFAIITLLCSLFVALPAYSQAIVLRPDDVLPHLKEASPDAFFINGPQIHGLTDEMAGNYYKLGDTAKLVLALVTLRLHDRGVIDLDEPVAKTLPDLLDFNPFEVAITPKHLLSETAGFTTPQPNLPPNAAAAPLPYFLIRSRGAGQIAVHDPIGWYLLVALLEHRTGKALPELLLEEVSSPLSLSGTGIRDGADEPWQIPLETAEIAGADIARLLQVLVWHKQADETPYLSPEAHGWLATNPLWQMHPLGPARYAGLGKQIIRRHQAIAPASRPCFGPISFAALPGAGLLFADLSGLTCNRFQSALGELLDRHVPPNFDRGFALEEAMALVPPQEIGHLFFCADSPPGLQARLAHAASCKLTLQSDGRGSLKLQRQNYDAISMATLPEKAPYYYGAEGEHLILSPYKAGGYAFWGMPFVRVDLLGTLQVKIHRYVPLMVIVLLSCALHIRSRASVQWRRFAAMGAVGTLLVSLGLYADWHWWPTVLYDWQQPWLIVLWRTGLNLGLMLVLALPMFAASFVKRQNMPKQGFALLFAGPHLGLISLAAIALFFATIIWGVAGTFSAY